MNGRDMPTTAFVQTKQGGIRKKLRGQVRCQPIPEPLADPPLNHSETAISNIESITVGTPG
jgi:hypothetical protein